MPLEAGQTFAGQTFARQTFAWADLREAKGVIYAHISFNWHGEQGRQLSAIKIDGAVVLFCGCFKGSEEDLMAYIERGDETYKQSRTIALNTVMSLIKS